MLMLMQDLNVNADCVLEYLDILQLTLQKGLLILLWRPKAHFYVYKRSLLKSIPSHINAVHIFILHLFKIHLKLLSHLRLGIPSGLFPSRLQTKFVTQFFISPMLATCPAHLIFLTLISLVNTNAAPSNSVFVGLQLFPTAYTATRQQHPFYSVN